jgi:hypothetical protein
LLAHVERYLLADLDTMLKVQNGDSGRLSFPILVTTFAGMETLGVLLSERVRPGSLAVAAFSAVLRANPVSERARRTNHQ